MQLYACAVLSVKGFKRRCQAADREQHDGHKRHEQQQRNREVMPALSGMHRRSENRQQQPGADVVNGCARDGGGPQVGSQQVAFFQDSGQYRESGDAHSRSHEECEGRKWNLASGILRIKHGRQPNAQGKRQHDADIADEHHRRSLFHDALEIDLKADHKHEEQKPKLT